MRVEEIDYDAPHSLVSSYISKEKNASTFFDYHPFTTSDWQRRANELLNRTFPRQQLANVIAHYHRCRTDGWTQEVERNIHLLQQENCLVVTGGQQAGLLLGPLYTLHKAVSIILLAKQQQEALKMPVVPVFWIAGEDHDFQEINHALLPGHQSSQLYKLVIEDPEDKRYSISHRGLPQGAILRWVSHFFEGQPQTEFSEQLKEKILECAKRSKSYVDFFAELFSWLFASYGLLMLDSADPQLRKLQSKAFCSIIEQHHSIYERVREQSNLIKAAGYQTQIELGEKPALLFIYEQQERLLLQQEGSGFITRNDTYTYTNRELLFIAEQQPERLSNNVLTRPYMQERLLPTLAFIAGPAEIAYWAQLKGYFHQLGMKLPILMPRLSVTLIEKPIARILEKRALSFKVLTTCFDAFKEDWLRKQDKLQLETDFQQVQDQVTRLYQPLIDKASFVEPGLKKLGVQNLEKIQEQILYFEKRTKAALSAQHEAAFRQFDKAEQALIPHGSLQERLHHPFTFFNRHGLALLDKLLACPLPFNGKHKLVYLE